MIKFTKHNLKKLETLFEEIEYTVRYEKGNFNAGYCVVKDKKIAIINKFYDTEGRMNCLIDILQSLDLDPQNLEEKSRSLYKEIKKNKALAEKEKEE